MVQLVCVTVIISCSNIFARDFFFDIVNNDFLRGGVKNSIKIDMDSLHPSSDSLDNIIEYSENGVFDEDVCDDGNEIVDGDKENLSTSSANRIRSTKAQLQKLDEHMEGNELISSCNAS